MEKLRVYYQVLGEETYYKEVKSPKEAKTVIDSIADFLNFAVDKNIFPDHCSTAGLEVYDLEEQDWVEWYDDNGLDLDEHFEDEQEGEYD